LALVYNRGQFIFIDLLPIIGMGLKLGMAISLYGVNATEHR
jgi:hypothetical protein